MNRRGAVIVNKLERCLGVEDREVEGIHIGAERCIERHRLCARDLVLYVLVPVGNQLFAQLRSVRQQATERCARASGGNKVVMTGCGVLTAVRVPDDLAELNPDIAGPKGVVIVLALVVIPYTLEALVVGESGNVNSHVASTREALDMFVLRRERSEERRVGKECRSRWSPYH